MPAINLWQKYTKNCIDTIKSEHLTKVIIINNASIDETITECAKLDDRFVTINNQERNSCAGSWNQGIDIAFKNGAKYVAVINNDILLKPETLDNMVECLEKNPDIMGCSCYEVPVTTSVGIFNAIHSSSDISHEGMHYSCFMLTKECWDKVGKFDEDIKPVYFEDCDYAYRLKLAGLRTVTIDSPFYHYGSKTHTDALGNGELICPPPAFEKNREYFIRKWGGPQGQEVYKTPFNK